MLFMDLLSVSYHHLKFKKCTFEPLVVFVEYKAGWSVLNLKTLSAALLFKFQNLDEERCDFKESVRARMEHSTYLLQNWINEKDLYF